MMGDGEVLRALGIAIPSALLIFRESDMERGGREISQGPLFNNMGKLSRRKK